MSRRAIDIHEGDKVNEAALKDLLRAAMALNLKGKSKPKPRQASRDFLAGRADSSPLKTMKASVAPNENVLRNETLRTHAECDVNDI
jgi:hypothetical protein